MRALLAASFLSILLAGCNGCISAEAKRQAVLNEACWTQFVTLMTAGETTREQEQLFIRSEAANASAMRANLGLEAGK